MSRLVKQDSDVRIQQHSLELSCVEKGSAHANKKNTIETNLPVNVCELSSVSCSSPT